MADTSRRTILTALSIAPVALSSKPAMSAAGSEGLHRRWNERRSLRSASRETAARIDAAEAALPWWAKAGPKYLNHDGSFSGAELGWPAIRDLQPPTHEGAVRLLRPSPTSLKEDHRRWCTIAGNTPATRAVYRKKLRALAIRKRERQAERDKVGLDALCNDQDAISDEIIRLSRAIDDLPDTSPDALAARLLVGLNFHMDARDTAQNNIGAIESTLRVLRPYLTGNIAVDVADLLDNPDSPITYRLASIR